MAPRAASYTTPWGTTGSYGRAVLRERDFAEGISISSADPGDRAVFTQAVKLSDLSGVTLEDIDLIAGGVAWGWRDPMLVLQKSDDLTVRDVTIARQIPGDDEGVHPFTPGTYRDDRIAGFTYGDGISLRYSEDVALENVQIRDVSRALLVTDSRDITVSEAEIHSVREGINLYDTSQMVVEASVFHHFQPWGNAATGDHGDMIQFWATNNDSRGIDGLTIRDNLFYQPDTMLVQSIYGNFSSTKPDVALENFSITGNVIVNSHANGIRIGRVDGFEIADNILLPGSETPRNHDMPRIFLTKMQNGVVENNITVARWNQDPTNLSDSEAAAAGIRIDGNRILIRLDGADPWQPVRNGLTASLPDAPKDDGPLTVKINGTPRPVRDGWVTDNDYGQAHVTEDGSMLSVWRNGWKAVEMDLTIVEDTVLRFEFAARSEGEIHCIGFARSDALAGDSFFALAGSQTHYGIQDYNGRYDGGVQRYEIAVGDYLAGQSFDRIVLAADDDAKKRGDSTFAEIAISGAGTDEGSGTGTQETPPGAVIALTIGADTFEILDGRVTDNDFGTAEISPDGTALTVAENGWKVAMMDLTITADTVLRFEFSAEALGEIHGIGFASGDDLQGESFFALAGSQTHYGFQDYNGLYTGGTQTYEIAVGDYLAGQSFDRIVLTADDDRDAAGTSTFADIEIA